MNLPFETKFNKVKYVKYKGYNIKLQTIRKHLRLIKLKFIYLLSPFLPDSIVY